jgi:hypothetical protein
MKEQNMVMSLRRLWLSSHCTENNRLALSLESAPHNNNRNRNYLKIISMQVQENLVRDPRWWPDFRTDWPTVRRQITLCLASGLRWQYSNSPQCPLFKWFMCNVAWRYGDNSNQREGVSHYLHHSPKSRKTRQKGNLVSSKPVGYGLNFCEAWNRGSLHQQSSVALVRVNCRPAVYPTRKKRKCLWVNKSRHVSQLATDTQAGRPTVGRYITLTFSWTWSVSIHWRAERNSCSVGPLGQR